MKGSPKSQLWTKHLTAQEFRELKACKEDIYYFATLIWLIHPKRGKVKFDLYPFQKSVLRQFLLKRFNIILKFRQAGITELISLYCLWLAMFFPHQNIQIISIKERTAKKVLRKIKFMYKNLPDHIKQPVTNGRGEELGTASELEFANGSIITSIPTTEEAGRSEAASLLVIDEAAILRWANTIWASAFPTLSTGGAAIVNSTPYGIGNWFHKMWVDACSGSKLFNPIRLKWQMHPERDMDWYLEQRSILGPRRTAQEIDGDFLGSGQNVFNLTDIKAIEEDIADLEYEIAGGMDGALYVLKHPEHGVKYTLGADIATGRARDYSTFTIYDETGEGVVSFKKKIGTIEFAKLIGKYGKAYNNALLAPEVDGVGLSVVSWLQENGYPNLYYSDKILRRKGEKRARKEVVPGWSTGKKNRTLIIDELERDIRLDHIHVTNPFFVQEAYTFIYDKENRPVAMGKDSKSADADDPLTEEVYTDDAIFAEAITNRVRKTPRKGPIIIPR